MLLSGSIATVLILALGMENSKTELARNPWCDSSCSCSSGKANSMCLYKPERNKTNCRNMMEEIENQTEWRNFWLALHNTLRDQVAAGKVDPWPIAANMRQLTWDLNSTLEEQARVWNYQCVLYQPDECNRNQQFRETQIGQVQINLKHDDLHDHGGDKPIYVKEFLKDLFLEVAGRYTNVPEASEMVERGLEQYIYGLPYFFSALLCAKTMVIGGSVIRSIWKTQPYRIVRTNTYFAPWYKGEPVYTKGYPCSACPAGWRCNKNSTYKYLCAKPSYPEDEEYVEGVPGKGRASKALKTIAALVSSLLILANTL